MLENFREKWQLAKMDVTKLYHRCEGKSCKFCEWRAQNHIDIGWERLFEDNPWDNSSDNSNAATYTEVDEESVFIVDEEILTVMDSIVEEHKCTDNYCKTVIENSYSGIDPHERPSSSTERAYGSPKSQNDIERSMECGVPQKTRNQTKWAVKVWTEWATSRNKKLLSDEAPFSCEIEKLSAQLINFWLCRFVLELRRRDGERYPPASLCQLCCGLLRHLRAAGRAEVNIFEQAEFHMFRTTLDSEMKRLSSTGQYYTQAISGANYCGR